VSGLAGGVAGRRGRGRRAGQKARQRSRRLIGGLLAASSTRAALARRTSLGFGLGGRRGGAFLHDRGGSRLGCLAALAPFRFEATVAFLAATLPTFATALAAAAFPRFAALALGAGLPRLAIVAVAPLTAFAVLPLTFATLVLLALAALLLGGALGLGLLGGEDGGGLGARLVLEVDVEALSGQLALGDLGHRPRRLQGAQNAEIVLGVLGVVLGENAVAGGGGVARQLHVALIDGLRVAANLDVLGALGVPRTVRIGGVGVAAARLPVASALTLHALEISHRTLPCLDGEGRPERCASGTARLRLPLRSGPIPADDVIGIRVVALWSAGRPARPSLPGTHARQEPEAVRGERLGGRQKRLSAGSWRFQEGLRGRGYIFGIGFFRGS